MSVALSPVLGPLLAAVGLMLLGSRRAADAIGIGGAAAALLAACLLAAAPPPPDGWLRADPLALLLVLLTGCIGLTTVVASLASPSEAQDRSGRSRLSRALPHTLLGCLMLALLSDNAGLTCVALEAATIAGALAVALSDAASARQAAWTMLMACGLGLVFALLGTALLYLAAQPALGPGLAALRWSTLLPAAARCNGALLSLAFVFLLVGYGTVAALVPLHGWVAEARTRAPMPVAVLSGGLAIVGVSVILRVRGLLAANAQAIAPGPPIMALGLASLLLAACALWRRPDPRRCLVLAAIGQGGVAAFAFGLGGPAILAGLLHLIVQALAGTAAWQCLGGERRGLIAGMLALAGLPPFGLIASEFMILGQTLRQAPPLAFPLGALLLSLAWALLRQLPALSAGSREAPVAITLPAAMQLALTVVLGLAMPGAVFAWLAAAAAGATSP